MVMSAKSSNCQTKNLSKISYYTVYHDCVCCFSCQCQEWGIWFSPQTTSSDEPAGPRAPQTNVNPDDVIITSLHNVVVMIMLLSQQPENRRSHESGYDFHGNTPAAAPAPTSLPFSVSSTPSKTPLQTRPSTTLHL